MKVSIFFPDGEIEELELDIPVDPELGLIKPIVDKAVSGYWERVTVFHNGKYTDMIIDEEGKLKNLPFNKRATEVYRNNTIVHCPGTNPNSLDFIVGGAVLFHEPISPRLAALL